MGGPLNVGDIEDLEVSVGNIIPTILCPWHFHRISLKDGCKLNKGITFDPVSKKSLGESWNSTPQFQRTHEVEIRSNGIYVKINESAGVTFKSDEYAKNSVIGEKTHQTKREELHKAEDGKRSGQVFNSWR